MAQTIKKRVDVVTPYMKSINNIENDVSFADILNLLNGKNTQIKQGNNMSSTYNIQTNRIALLALLLLHKIKI